MNNNIFLDSGYSGSIFRTPTDLTLCDCLLFRLLWSNECWNVPSVGVGALKMTARVFSVSKTEITAVGDPPH
jgi:hypothetical protein